MIYDTALYLKKNLWLDNLPCLGCKRKRKRSWWVCCFGDLRRLSDFSPLIGGGIHTDFALNLNE